MPPVSVPPAGSGRRASRRGAQGRHGPVRRPRRLDGAGGRPRPGGRAAAVRPQVTRMREELERFGGTFEKYVGDAVMAVFGAPVAHEDDPERACAPRSRSATRFPEFVSPSRQAKLWSRSPRRPDGRGDRDRRRRQHDLPNRGGGRRRHRARRRDAYRATEATIDYGPRRLLQARGKQSRSRSTRRSARRSTFPRVRRARARAADRPEGGAEADHRHDRAGSPRPDPAAGDARRRPGIGKSRLVWELQRALEDEPGLVTWRRGRCLPYGDGVPSGRSARWSRRRPGSSRATRRHGRDEAGPRGARLVADTARRRGSRATSGG